MGGEERFTEDSFQLQIETGMTDELWEQILRRKNPSMDDAGIQELVDSARTPEMLREMVKQEAEAELQAQELHVEPEAPEAKREQNVQVDDDGPNKMMSLMSALATDPADAYMYKRRRLMQRLAQP